MTQSVCAECGEASPSGVQFCPSCGHYLWSSDGPVEEPAVDLHEVSPAVPADPPPVNPTASADPPTAYTDPPTAYRAVSADPPTAILQGRVPARSTPEDRVRPDPVPPDRVRPDPVPADRGRVAEPRRDTARPPEVVVADGDVVLQAARSGGVELRVRNPSSIVEGYRVEFERPPPWLSVTVPEIRLLPGDRTSVRIGFDVRPATPVVAQRLRLRVRVRPESDERVHADVEIALVVPRMGGPVRIRTEPAVVRVKDALRGRFTVHLDNRGANHPRRVTFSGSDDEGVVRFEFDPAVVEVPPDGGAAVQVRVMAPPPAAGERSDRSLTVRAIDDGTELPAVVRLIQETSDAPVEVPVRLRLEPSALRTDDSPVAELQVVVDNRGGNRERRVRLVGHDPEKRIGFVFRTVELWVPPGVERATPAQLRAPAPPAGEQVDRTFTVTATDGRHEIESAGHWVQRSAVSPITTAAIRLEPEGVRVRDRPDAHLSVVVDNQRGTRPLRVRLSGQDPEGAVRFAFQPAVLDIGPGRVGRADMQVVAPPPPHGEESVRALRVRAVDDHGAVEATGALHQYSSPAAISTARLTLEPQRVVTRNTGTGRLRVQLDNRAGAFPLAARLYGTDPEQVVRFAFRPSTLEIAPGQVGVADVRLSAPRPDGGETLTRPFTVVADDGRGAVDAAGSFVQSAGDRRPVWRVVLTVLGALLVAVGCFRDWVVNDPDSLLPGLSTTAASIRRAAAIGAPATAQEAAGLIRTLEPIERTLTLLLAGLMVFGLVGSTGRLTRMTGVVVALTMVVVALFWRTAGAFSLADGTFLVAVGGLVGFVGGLCVRR